VDAVLAGQSADAALAAPGAPGGPAVRAIALGTLRWYLRLAPAVDSLLERPGSLRGPVRALLATAAHQVEYSRNPPEATVHAAVDAARILGSARASSLVNAVLRRFVASRAALLASVDATLPGRTAHPAWLVERIAAAWPQQCPAILDADNAHPPMTLRVDLSRSSAAEVVVGLRDASIEAREIQWCPSAVTLERPTPVERLPAFAQGRVSVQDAGAQLAAPLLEVRPGLRVLDACAAPGGKTGHLLERMGEGADLTAVDIDRERLQRVGENLARLKRAARLVAADVREPESFWDGRPFDRILVDAPCSATGVIRRHPDIKLLRRPGDLAGFRAQQGAILEAAVRMLAPGGRLLYATCSLLPEENEDIVQAMLASAPGLAPGAMPAAATLAPGALERSVGVQLLPGMEAGTDGFYYACLEKTTTGT
jgi:16S rRNA (cytosine967-C5)-methyltransferase